MNRLNLVKRLSAIALLTLSEAFAGGDGEETRPDTTEVEKLQPSTQEVQPAEKRPEDFYSAKDFYYWQGQRVPLRRSLSEFAVQFAPGTPKEAQAAITRTLFPQAELVETSQGENRTLSVVTLKGVTRKAESEKAMEILRARPEVVFVFPVLFNQKTGTRMLLTDAIVLKLKPGHQLDELTTRYPSYGLTAVKKLWGADDEYVVRLQNPKAVNPLEVAAAFVESGLVEWAEPDFVQEYKTLFTPNDPLYLNQWHLHNSGQGGGAPDADVDAPEAWDVERGSANITIAVLDDGVQISHPDLAANIFTNPGEVPGNGVDDDANGFIDDVNGWDFANSDNDPRPFFSDGPGADSHGTSVAGVAAARGNNVVGVSGVCQNCKILPIKIANVRSGATQFENFSDVQAANAIRYAASLADVLNNSWGGGSPSNAVQSAIQDATSTGRGGKGAVVLFASGNSASGYQFRTTDIPAGTHRFRWTYFKDDSVSSGDDTVWLGWVVFPGGELVNFENGAPGWTTGGNAPWTVVNDSARADSGRCFTHAAKAGAITHNQSTYIEVVKTVPAGTMSRYQWVSSEPSPTGCFDGFQLAIDLNNNGVFDSFFDPSCGVPFIDPAVGYPAAFPETIAVGASSNFDCRSYYSQFGSALDVVTSSGAGPLNLKIETTDRTGADGYNNTSDYTSAFGPSGFSGTSSACPLASGIAALVLSQDPNLTENDVRQRLQDTADKIGPEPYVAGRNDRYGFGRLNAQRALSVPPCSADCATSFLPVCSGPGWGAVGGLTPSAPHATVDAISRVRLFARGLDNGIWQNIDAGLGFQGWSLVGGLTESSLASVVDAINYVRLFARGVDNGIWQNIDAGNGFTGWTPLGGLTPSALSAVLDGANCIRLLGRGVDNGIWQNKDCGSGFQGWTPLGGLTPSALSAVVDAVGYVHLFARGVDNGIWQNTDAGGGFTGWTPLGGLTEHALASVLDDNNDLHLFARGVDQRVWENVLPSGASCGWTGWQPIRAGGLTPSTPAAVSDISGVVRLFAQGVDSGIYEVDSQ